MKDNIQYFILFVDEIPMFTEMTISEGGDTSTKSETTEVSAHVSLQVSSTTAQSSLSPNDTSPGSESPGKYNSGFRTVDGNGVIFLYFKTKRRRSDPVL